MRKLFFVFAVLAGIGVIVPAYAEEDGTGSKSELVISPFAPEILAQAVEQETAAAQDPRLAAVEKRITNARKGISRGKKMVLWAAIIGLPVGTALWYQISDECLSGEVECTSREQKFYIAGLVTASATGGIMGYGLRSWLFNTISLRRAEKEKSRLTGGGNVALEVTPTAVTASYQIGWR